MPVSILSQTVTEPDAESLQQFQLLGTVNDGLEADPRSGHAVRARS